MKCANSEFFKRWLKKVSLLYPAFDFVDSCSGLIYRHHRPVHYSFSSRSALAEAELVYKDDHVSHSVYVTFCIDRRTNIENQVLRQLVSTASDVELLVWTTTPWTLTANMVRLAVSTTRSFVTRVQAIAVNPNLMYAIVRCSDVRPGKFLIVASERLVALSEIIGPVDIYAELPGMALSSALTLSLKA